MSRALDAEILAAISGGVVKPFFTVDLLFPVGSVAYAGASVESGPLYLWTGVGTATIEGKSYVGTGQFLELSAFEETTEIAARNATVTLSGIPSDLLALALSTPYQGHKCLIKFGVFGDDESVLKEDGAYLLKEDNGQIELESSGQNSSRSIVFNGYMDQMTIAEGPETSQIAMTVESRLIDLDRVRLRRYTSEDQKSRFPGDLAFDFVNDLQDKEIFWGRR
jgi:hypothetical protein